MVDINAEKKTLREFVDVTFKAENKKDLKTLLEFFADDVIVQGPGAPQFTGIKALREFYEGYLKTLVSIKGESTQIEISSAGDMAWDVGYNNGEYKGPEGIIKDQGKYFASYKKVNGKWKCAAIAFSSDKPS